MKLINLISVCFTFFIIANLQAQVNVSVTVNSADISTTCQDLFSAPDPLFQVNINGLGNTTYPQENNCFTALPNEQFNITYDCGQAVVPVVNVCFKVFENDALVPCTVFESCAEEICQDFPLPLSANQDYTLSLPAGGNSEGTLYFNIAITGTPLNPVNDQLCDAIDLGQISLGNTLGDATTGSFTNVCATYYNELNVCDFTNANNCNQNSVWFSFTTDNTPPPTLSIRALNYTQNGNDPFPIQLSGFRAVDNTCTGTFEFLDNHEEFANANASLTLNCPLPNATYYLMVAGENDVNTNNEGEFGIEVQASPYADGPDLPCDAYDMGTVPLGGSIAIPNPIGNLCAGSVGDPTNVGFESQNSVFFSFTPSSTGHVSIKALNAGIDAINLQVALFESDDNTCTGNFTELASDWDYSFFNQTISASCLSYEKTYWVLIDGTIEAGTGYFTLEVSDAGSNNTVIDQNEMICYNGSITVGANTYTQAGMYTDTLPLPDGCFEVVNTTVSIRPEVTADVTFVNSASAENATDGEVLITPMGGIGTNYTYAWSNGLTIPNPNNLTGGTNYCVTITDDDMCEGVECFLMPFVNSIIPTFTDGSVPCNGDNTGQIVFSVQNGSVPYYYNWNGDNGLFGAGVIGADNEDVIIDNLTAGTYTISVNDNDLDTMFTAVVTQPNPILITAMTIVNPSCFGECDGSLDIQITGGTPPYSYLWTDNTTTPPIDQLCAGTYALTIVDSNGCTLSDQFTLTEPEEFTISTNIVQNVSCIGGSDGIATVSTNGNPDIYVWDTPNNDNTATASNLPEGTYNVTVTDVNGCEATASATISQPMNPLEVSIEIIEPVSCNGSSDAELSANVTGIGSPFTYNWSNGENSSAIEDLPAGSYSVTVENVVGCTADATINLTEPDIISVTIDTKDANCTEGDFSGAVYTSEVSGGIAPYLFSTDGEFYTPFDTINSLEGGSYNLYIQDSLGCVNTFDFEILPPPSFIADIGEDREVLLGETIFFDTDLESADIMHTWFSSDTIPSECLVENCRSIEVLPIQNGIYGVTALDTITGCTSIDSVYITVNKKRFVYIPNAFSPNDDGINDMFFIMSKQGVKEIKSLKIFNRYGGLVFTKENFQPNIETEGFSGFVQGVFLNPDVYLYVAKIIFIDEETEIFSGDVTLMR